MRLRRARRLLIQVAKDYSLTAVMLALWAAGGAAFTLISRDMWKILEAWGVF